MLASAVSAFTRWVSEKDTALYALVAGDTGNGEGSRKVYAALPDILSKLKPRGLTFHYLLPEVDWHNRVLIAVEALEERPLLAADAGFMYAAKMSGYAGQYDLFTPDIGELAFLADEKAPHPFYTRNFLLSDESMAPELIAKAYAHDNAAKHMLVKGQTDRYVLGGEILDSVDGPDIPALEAIGGTGDTLTGIASACLAAGMPMRQACLTAMRANRRMGELAEPTPASSIADLLRHLPRAASELHGSLPSGQRESG
jgi:NAD(P)H-hydrate repair Nnr-like enzyme with NAD(P)H-hydrate dehydratase domain